jgi:hypothetical protein
MLLNPMLESEQQHYWHEKAIRNRQKLALFSRLYENDSKVKSDLRYDSARRPLC